VWVSVARVRAPGRAPAPRRGCRRPCRIERQYRDRYRCYDRGDHQYGPAS